MLHSFIGLVRKKRILPARRGERGQSLVEMALSLPMLMAILMGVVDVSFVLYASIQVAAASAEGARAGALFVGDFNQTVAQNDAARTQAVRNAVYNTGTGATTMGLLRTTSPNFSVNSDVTVTYPNSAGSTTRTGEEVVVRVAYRQPVWFEFLPGAVSGLFGISSSTRVRMQ